MRGVIAEVRGVCGDLMGYRCKVCSRRVASATSTPPRPFPHADDCEAGGLERECGPTAPRERGPGMRVQIDKYEIKQEPGGPLRVTRGGEPWMTDPAGSKMLVAAAYELVALRKLVGEAVRLAADARLVAQALPSAALTGRFSAFDRLAAEMDGLVDWRRHIDDPGDA